MERAKNTLEHDEGWTLSQSLFGVKTYYRREPDNSLSLKLDGELSGAPLFEQVAVLREVDLHYKWSPFCTSSMTLHNIDKLDTVGWAVVGLPQFGLARDASFRAFGCDDIQESASFYIVGQGVEDRNPNKIPYEEEYFLQGMEGIQIPAAPNRLGSGRITVRGFSAVVHVLSPTKVHTRIVSNINPNLAFVPQSLLDFVMRKMCGVVLGKLQHAAKRAAADPIHNAHAQRMRQDAAFYKEWLMPKFESYCNHVGWTMSPVAAFNLTPEELQLAADAAQQRQLNGDSDKVPPVRSLTSMESAPSSSMNGNNNNIHPSASAPDLENVQVVNGAAAAAAAEVDVVSGDSNSGVSSVSGASSIKSFLRDNRISQYLRELEERTQKEKARKIAEGRQNMAEQLRPRSMTEEKYTRLQQLKQAKARRQRRQGGALSLERNASVRTDAAVAEDTAVLEVDTFAFTDRFHTHGRTTRFAVAFLLAFVLLVTLYSDKLLGFHDILRIHADTIWMNGLLDMATFAYLVVSAAVFFVMSYVSLVYAFHSLDIGTKSGARSKAFYDETIRYIVAGISGALVVLSIGRAIVSVWLRVGLWRATQMSQWAKRVFENASSDGLDLAWLLDYVPAPMSTASATTLSTVSSVVTSTVDAGWSAALFVKHWFVVIVIRSNFVGRALAALTSKAAGIFAYTLTAWEQYVCRVLDMYTDDGISLASWRGVAIDTARPLLAYAAVFLVSILVLFNCTTQKKEVKKEENSPSVNAESLPVQPTPMEVAPSQPAAARRLDNQAVSSITVQEDIVAEEEKDLSISVSPSYATDVVVGSTETARKKKRFRLRLRKKKENGVTDGASVQSSITGTTSSRVKRMETC